MGDRENSDELLPDGCRVEVRVRKNGKKDKIIIEKDTPDGLPPGWTKEIKVTKTGRKVRRDPYYIDPASGYIFRSMKDAVRYVETGEIGRLAYKPKDDGNQDEEDLEDDKDNSPTATKKQKLEVTGTETDITSQSTKLSEVAKDEDALDSAGTRECISHSEHTSGQVVVLPQGQSSDVGEMMDETMNTTLGKSRSRKKKVFDLPRRASKRLAGLALDPTPELKTSNRVRRKQSDKIEASSTVEAFCSGSQVHLASQQPDQLEAKPEANCAFDTSKSTEVSSATSEAKHPSGDLNASSGKIETGCKSDQPQGCAVDLTMKHPDNIETDIEADKNPSPLIDLPFGDLLSDPCIAFAIKTLTGETFETSSDKEVSLESNSGKSEGFAFLEGQAGKKRENEGEEKQENLATSEEQAANVESKLKTDEKLENPLDLPFADIWRDPCIEFAIKTLTGAIPVGNDWDVQDYFQQQINSSQTQPNNNFCQTEFLCQQFDSLEKPVSREQARTGNLSIQNPGGSGFHQQSEKRCNECH
ncbi:hypothetical protein KPL71_025520 [Citrus sinensis]|uniref:Uncharacterized protein n=1 Tax=Citrus sinensis TaxID=2711 RepID=A0ACB8HSX9_CITSI|nr:hypothetical protein KPL71_025520 [Citrus sinensis]